MSRKIILIRHAKSGWDDPIAEDHERTLSARGRDAAPRIGAWLAERGHRPDLMLVSNAARTVETADLIRAAWDTPPPVKYAANLYLASPDTMLQALQATEEPCVALVAHNPGIAILAEGLLKRAPNHPRFRDYPTAATTVIEFDDAPRLHAGRCIDFTVPRDLAD